MTQVDQRTSAGETAPGATSSLQDRGASRERLQEVVIDNALLFALAAMIIYFSWRSPAFLDVGNFRNIGIQSSVIALVAVPSALLILTGAVDLSVGSTTALGAVVAGVLLADGVDPGLAALAGIGAGAAVGMANGVLVCVLGFSSIIVTLGGLTAVRGLAQSLTDQPPFGFPEAFLTLGSGSLLGIPIPIVLAAGAFLVGILVLRNTAWGRHIYAIGVNREAAYLSGISTERAPFVLFVFVGAAAGLGGLITAARLDSSPAGTIGTNFELDVLTAILLGGVAFEGGRGTVFGVLQGVVFLAVLQNGLTLLNVSNNGTLLAKGLALVTAAALASLAVRRDRQRTLRASARRDRTRGRATPTPRVAESDNSDPGPTDG